MRADPRVDPRASTITPTALDNAYAAGVLDGEGSLCLIRVRPSKDSRYRDGLYYRPVVQVANTRPELLLWLLQRYGGSIQGPFTPTAPNAKPVLHWMGLHSKARTILEACLPHLLLKRRQAELLLEAGSLKSFPSRPPEVMARLAEIYIEMRSLNRRGLA